MKRFKWDQLFLFQNHSIMKGGDYFNEYTARTHACVSVYGRTGGMQT